MRDFTRLEMQSDRSCAVSLKSPQRGFTVIELLVSMTVISILISLLLPAIMHLRETARNVQCKNHLKQLGLAMTQEADVRRRFPASGNISKIGPERYHSWVVNLLPWIEQQNLYDQWKYDLPFDVLPNSETAANSLSLLVCPSDPTVVEGGANLSYVTNGGFGWTISIDCPATFEPIPGTGALELPIDLNGDGETCLLTPPHNRQTDADVLLMSGMFFNENWPHGNGGTARHHTLNSISDGLSNTMMISENVRVGYDPQGGGGWATPDPWRNSFFISGRVCRDLSCVDGNVDYSLANNHNEDPLNSRAINSPLSLAEGEAPWLSSLHRGGVNVVYVDGRVEFLSELINGLVLASLMSPRGSEISGPLSQSP